MANSGQSSAMSHGGTAAETDQQFRCPLCELTASDDDDIYRHLMVSHRKSELSTLLMNVTDLRNAASPQNNPV